MLTLLHPCISPFVAEQDSDPANYTRLRWLNSDLAQDDDVVTKHLVSAGDGAEIIVCIPILVVVEEPEDLAAFPHFLLLSRKLPQRHWHQQQYHQSLRKQHLHQS